MQQPEGHHFGESGDVLLLKKSLYGLKQAGRVWNETLDKALVSMGFQQIKSDASMYVYAKDSVRIFVPVFIDDITIFAPNKTESDKIVAKLKQQFEHQDRGLICFLLRMTSSGTSSSTPLHSFNGNTS